LPAGLAAMHATSQAASDAIAPALVHPLPFTHAPLGLLQLPLLMRDVFGQLVHLTAVAVDARRQRTRMGDERISS